MLICTRECYPTIKSSKYQPMLQHGRIVKHYAKFKKPVRKGSMSFHVYETSRKGKSKKTERRLAVARGWGRRGGNGL